MRSTTDPVGPAPTIPADTRPTRVRWLGAVAVIGLLIAAVVLVILEPWHGPIMLSLSSAHGIDTGDAAILPLAAAALVIGRRAGTWSAAPLSNRIGRMRGRWVGSASAVVLGLLLLLAGAIHIGSPGPLVPAGGGTLGGEVRFTGGGASSPVQAWSHEALTYDGHDLRLYVNGHEVSHQPATGVIQRTARPLWIGGNQPYGEFFRGVIDEVRVYGRALDAAAIRADMATPIGSTTGLVAAYPFDAKSANAAPDASGHGNAATINGAQWTGRGYFGGALHFDGDDDVLRVPASESLNLGPAMTLSAWIWPDTPQFGWRTIVQREVDAYFLTAGSDIDSSPGRLDDVLAGLTVAAALWFGVILVASRGSWLGVGRRRDWWVLVVLVLGGCAVDAVLAQSGTVVGPALAAAWLAAVATSRTEAIAGWLLALGFAAATVASVVDPAGIGVLMARDDGGIARSVAFGALLVLTGLLRAIFGSPAPTAARPIQPTTRPSSA